MNKIKSLFFKSWFLVAIIIILASFLRLYNITFLPPGLYPDEAMNGNNALEAISAGNFKMFYPENNGREGLFINIQAIFVYIFGNEPWALRSASALFGIFTVLGVYLLALEIFWNNKNNKKIALFSSFLIATSFWHINFSRIGFRAIMAPFFLVFSFYLILKSVRLLKENYFCDNSNKNVCANSNGKIYFFAALAGFIYGLGMHSYIAYRATPLLIIAGFAYRLFYFKELRVQIIKLFAMFAIFSFLAFLPLGIYFLKNPQDFFGRTAQVSVFSSPNILGNLTTNILKTAAMFNFSGDYNWRHNYAGRPALFWPIGILFLIGIILGISILFKKKNKTVDELSAKQNPDCFKKFSFLMLFLWIIIAALPIIISNEGLPHALRAILLIPPIFILAGVGGVWLYEFIKNKLQNALSKKILTILSFTFLFLLALEGYNTYFDLWGKNPNIAGAFAANYIEMGKQLNNLPKDLPKYIIVDANGVNVRGIPMPTQTVMFITDTFTPEKQKKKNIYYILPDKINDIPQGSYTIYLK